MKKTIYLSLMAILFGVVTIGCTGEIIRPTEDEEEDDPIIVEIPPKPTTSQSSSDTLVVH